MLSLAKGAFPKKRRLEGWRFLIRKRLCRGQLQIKSRLLERASWRPHRSSNCHWCCYSPPPPQCCADLDLSSPRRLPHQHQLAGATTPQSASPSSSAGNSQSLPNNSWLNSSRWRWKQSHGHLIARLLAKQPPPTS